MNGSYNQSNGGAMQEVTNTNRLSQRVAGLKPSGIRRFFDIAATMKDVISLGIGEPDFTTPKPILDAGIRSLQHGETHYTSNWGRMELRQAISDHLQSFYKVKYDPATEVVATVGVSEALYLTFVAILDPGDEVIIPTPCFVSYQAEVILAGGVPVEAMAREAIGRAEHLPAPVEVASLEPVLHERQQLVELVLFDDGARLRDDHRHGRLRLRFE